MKEFSKIRPDVIGHVADTWLLANGIHLITLAIIGWHSIFSMGKASVIIVFVVALAAFAASLPCLVAAYFCLGIIARSILPAKILFMVWLVVCPSIVLVAGVLFEAWSKAKDFPDMLYVPGVIASLLAVIFRYRQFRSLINHYQSYSSK